MSIPQWAVGQTRYLVFGSHPDHGDKTHHKEFPTGDAAVKTAKGAGAGWKITAVSIEQREDGAYQKVLWSSYDIAEEVSDLWAKELGLL